MPIQFVRRERGSVVAISVSMILFLVAFFMFMVAGFILIGSLEDWHNPAAWGAFGAAALALGLAV